MSGLKQFISCKMKISSRLMKWIYHEKFIFYVSFENIFYLCSSFYLFLRVRYHKYYKMT